MQKIDYKYFIKKIIPIHITERKNSSNLLENRILMHLKDKNYLLEKGYYSSLEETGHRAQYHTILNFADTRNRLNDYFFEYNLKIFSEIIQIYYRIIFVILRENRSNLLFLYRNAQNQYSDMKLNGSITKVLYIWSNLIRTVLPKSLILLLLLPFREKKTIFLILELNIIYFSLIYLIIHCLYLNLLLDFVYKLNLKLISIEKVNFYLLLVPYFKEKVIL